MQKQTNKKHISYTFQIFFYSKCIIDTNVKCKTIKLLEENKGENQGNHGFGKNVFRYKTESIIHEEKNRLSLTF